MLTILSSLPITKKVQVALKVVVSPPLRSVYMTETAQENTGHEHKNLWSPIKRKAEIWCRITSCLLRGWEPAAWAAFPPKRSLAFLWTHQVEYKPTARPHQK